MAKQPFEEVPAGLQALWRQAPSFLWGEERGGDAR